jgi:hypothetical protein
MAERRSARRESNSQAAARRAASLPWNSRARALRASGRLVCRFVWRVERVDSLSLRVCASGVRVERVLVKVASRVFCAAMMVSSGEMGARKGLEGTARGWRGMQLAG